VGGALVLRGAVASNSAARTGNGGTASVDGSGGSSGSVGSIGKDGKVYAGGAAGKGGELKITAGGAIVTSEGIFATGGDAGALSPLNPSLQPGLYYPVTGNAGSGTRLGQGGDSGDIGGAGEAGSVSITTKNPLLGVPPSLLNIEADRILVNGGRAGTDPDPDGAFVPAGNGVQHGVTGNGGDGGAGGKAGRVGGGVVGGKGGTIEVTSGGAIKSSVQYFADGGRGGDQAGIAGHGGKALDVHNGGAGGSVDGAGNGGDAGKIVLTAKTGITLKEAE